MILKMIILIITYYYFSYYYINYNNYLINISITVFYCYCCIEYIKKSLVDEGKLTWDLSIINGPKDNEKWLSHYNALVAYGIENKTCNIQQAKVYTFEEKPFKLGNWLNKQRKDKRSGVLSEEREQKLQILVDKNLLKWNMYYCKNEETKNKK